MPGEVPEDDTTAANNAAFDEGFDTQDTDAQTTTPDADPAAAPAPVAEPAAAPVEALPEYVQIPKADWEDLKRRTEGFNASEVQRLINQANGNLGGLKQRVDRMSQGGTVEISPDDFKEMREEFGEEYVKSHIAGLQRVLARSRPADTAPDQPANQPTTTPAEARLEEMRRQVVDAQLDTVMDGDWRAEVAKPEFSVWMRNQPADVQALGASDNVRDATRMLTLYRKALAAVQTAAPAAPAPPAAPKPPSTRQRVLDAAVNPRGTGGHAQPATVDDAFDDAFKN